MGKAVLRFVQETDAARILEIYTPYIRDTAVTFECEAPSLAAFTQRIREISAQYPYIVCEIDGYVVGYAYAHRQKERAAYGWNAELSVYLKQDSLRMGIGKAFYTALGFAKLGVYHKTGYKCGAWHDVAWFERRIGDGTGEPAPFLPVHALDKQVLNEILDQCRTLIRA